ncbi:hypothetical protein ACLKA6_014741 [Drosophila palustris]
MKEQAVLCRPGSQPSVGLSQLTFAEIPDRQQQPESGHKQTEAGKKQVEERGKKTAGSEPSNATFAHNIKEQRAKEQSSIVCIATRKCVACSNCSYGRGTRRRATFETTP